MTTPVRYLVVLVALMVVITACRKSTSVELGASDDWWASTNSPVIALWDGGIQMIPKPPFVVFALWGDGMFVRSVEGRLQRGQVSSEAIRRLMAEVEAARFFSPPLAHGLIRPDGSFRRLAAMRNGELVRLDYGGDRDFRNIGPHHSPSRQQMDAFVQMWERVMRAIDVLPVGELSDYRGERELRFPGSGTRPLSLEASAGQTRVEHRGLSIPSGRARLLPSRDMIGALNLF